MQKPSIKDILNIDLPLIEVVDIGAMPEARERYASLVEHGLANVTGFEPNPEQFEILCATKKGPYKYLPYFLGCGGAAAFHIVQYPDCSSLYPPDPNVVNLFYAMGTEEGSLLHVLRTIEVETKRWDDVTECPAASYLKIDVQGAELDVLRNGIESLKSVLILEAEVEFLPIYKGQPLFPDICTFLANQGFVFHKLIDVAGFPIRPFLKDNNPTCAISQMHWADAIFIRDFTKLERYSNDQLLIAATILHESYCSYDLSFHLLREYDERMKTDISTDYFNSIRNHREIPYMYLNPKKF